MPELPEVESVCRGLRASIGDSCPVEAVICHRADLRFKLPKKQFQKIGGLKVQTVSRRAKYILFQMGEVTLLNHLGMTGAWRWDKKPKSETHDHVALKFGDGRYLIYNDPRRFGFFDVLSTGDLAQSKWLSHLGPEPLDKEFDGAYLFQKTRGVKRPIKNHIMNQELVVGVGNIYAAEALFAAGIRPMRPAGRLTRAECDLLVKEIRKVLRRAIQHGGTTLSDYRQVDGEEGAFQNRLMVYGRGGKACMICSSEIKKQVMAGRSSFWCSKCQR